MAFGLKMFACTEGLMVWGEVNDEISIRNDCLIKANAIEWSWKTPKTSTRKFAEKNNCIHLWLCTRAHVS